MPRNINQINRFEMEWLFPATYLSPWRVVLEANRFHLDKLGNLPGIAFSLHLQVLFDISSLEVPSVFMATDSASTNFLLQSKRYVNTLLSFLEVWGLFWLSLLFLVKTKESDLSKIGLPCNLRQRFPSLSTRETRENLCSQLSIFYGVHWWFTSASFISRALSCKTLTSSPNL